MKILSLSLLLLVITMACFSQNSKGTCQNCGRRMVLCWDFSVLTKPVSSTDSISWKQLHYASDAYIKSLMGKESPECLGFLPSCRTGDEMPPWEKPCPYNGQSQSETFNFDYEMFGDITGAEGAYIMRLSLVTVKRETVASITKKFKKASDAKWFGSLAALDLGGSDVGSRKLYDVIHEFEIKKRDAAQGIKYNRVALNATVRFKSEKNIVGIDNRILIEMELKDCDDEPLKSALLELQVAKGKFENNNVETDDKGIAHATYIAPGEPCTVKVKVEYKYRYPGEKTGYASDFTEINVAKPVDSLYADIKIYLYTKENYLDGEGKLASTSETEATYSTTVECRDEHEVIQGLLNLRRPLTAAEIKSPIRVLSGTSIISFLNPVTYAQVGIKKYPLIVSQRSVTHSFRTIDGGKQWVKSSEGNCEGTADGGDGGIEISIEKLREFPSFTSTMSDDDYVFLFNGVGNCMKLVEGCYGNGKNRCWDDAKKQLDDCGDEGRCKVTSPGKTCFSDQEYFDNELISPLIIQATGTLDQQQQGDDNSTAQLTSTGFEEYLLNPKGPLTLYLEGSSYLNEEGNKMMWQSAFATIRLSPINGARVNTEATNVSNEDPFSDKPEDKETLRKRVLDKIRKYNQEHPGSMFEP